MTTDMDVIISIEDASKGLELQFSGMDMLKTNARTVFSAASLVTSLVAALQIFRPVSVPILPLYIALLVIGTALYVGLIALCIRVMSPVELKTPIEIKWDTFKADYFQKDDRELLLQRLSNYVNAHEANAPILDKRIEQTKAVSELLVVLIIYLLIVSIIPSLFQ